MSFEFIVEPSDVQGDTLTLADESSCLQVFHYCTTEESRSLPTLNVIDGHACIIRQYRTMQMFHSMENSRGR